MSVDKLNELKDLLHLDNFDFVGFTLYFLEEDSNKELIPMKIEMDNEDMEVENSISNLKSMLEHKNLVDYLQETDLSPEETIGYVNEEYLESFTRVKSLITSEEDLPIISKQEDLDDVKGLLVQMKLRDKNDLEIKDILLYSQITGNNLYRAKPLWSISFESEAVLERINKPVINLNLNYCSIHYEDKIFVLHSHFFEQLFKVYIRFENASEEVLSTLADMNLISNITEFKERCRHNKNFQRKLFHIKHSGSLDNLTYESYCEVNEKVGGVLKIIFNADETISIDTDNEYQSIDQIIRIMNNEAAETIITEEAIFAGRKQMIE